MLHGDNLSVTIGQFSVLNVRLARLNQEQMLLKRGLEWNADDSDRICELHVELEAIERVINDVQGRIDNARRRFESFVVRAEQENFNVDPYRMTWTALEENLYNIARLSSQL